MGMARQVAGRPDGRLRSGATVLVAAGVALVTFVVFLPAIRNGFVDLDDPVNITNNPHIRGLGPGELRWMFTTFLTGPYQPLSWLSLALDYQLWGLDPRGYHFTSLMWHVSAAVVWYFASRRLLQAAILYSTAGPLSAAAAVSALLFAIHPLRVESVAWATERRDVLCVFFGVCTLWAYLSAVSQQRSANHPRRFYVASVLLYVASLLSKASTVPLPLVLSVLDVWPLRRIPSDPRCWLSAASRRVWIEKLPFWFASGGAAILAIYGQVVEGMVVPAGWVTPLERFGLSCYSLTFYLWKFVCPIQVSPLYELRLPVSQWHDIFLAAAGLVLGITAVSWLLRHRIPGLLAGWISFASFVAPVSGVFKSGAQRCADRYTYLPSLSLSILVAGTLLWAVTRFRPGFAAKVVIGMMVLLVLGTFGTLSWRQCSVWRDGESFWMRVVQLDPRSSYGWAGLGAVRANAGQLAEASEMLDRSIALGTPLALPHYYLAAVRFQMGKVDEAIEPLRESLVRDPNFADSWYLLGQYWERKQDWPAATAAYQRCIEVQPEHRGAAARLNFIHSRAIEPQLPRGPASKQ